MIAFLLSTLVSVRVIVLTSAPASLVQNTAIITQLLNPSIRITDVRYYKDPYPQLNKISYQIDRLQNLSEWARRKRLNKNVDAVHFVVSPMNDGGYLFVGGLARGYCKVASRLSFSMSNYSPYNVFGAPRYAHSVFSAAHEVAHIMGANHNNEYPNIMHAAALQFVDRYALGWTQQSKNEVATCLRSKGLK